MTVRAESDPWTAAAVAVYVSGRYACSGTAVTADRRTFVITAAGCVPEPSMPPDGSAPAPSLPASPPPPGTTERPEDAWLGLRPGRDLTAAPAVAAARSVDMRPEGGATATRDIGIWQAMGPLPGVVALPLGRAGRGTVVAAVGWGVTTAPPSSEPTRVGAVPVRVAGAGPCAGARPAVGGADLCAQATEPGVCLADRGGALLADVGGVLSVVGVASRTSGEGCDRAGVYTAVDGEVHRWIAARLAGWTRDDAGMAEELERDRRAGLVTPSP
ncbi:MAG: trypsin-like serine protease [Solirubrobacterales bacterium]|nr:trypsin-like serine protease [Solirubrobacterales bacterium]